MADAQEINRQSKSSLGDWTRRDQVLAKQDEQHRISICEYNIIHLDWGEHRLVYCPGDFLGLSFMLSALSNPCNLECENGEDCPAEIGDHILHLKYGSVDIPIARDECPALHKLVKQAVERLTYLQNTNYFANHR